MAIKAAFDNETGRNAENMHTHSEGRILLSISPKSLVYAFNQIPDLANGAITPNNK